MSARKVIGALLVFFSLADMVWLGIASAFRTDSGLTVLARGEVLSELDQPEEWGP